MADRRVLALAIAGVLLLSVASATSLGELSGVSFWATAVEEPDAVCEVSDGTVDTTFYEGTLGSLSELSLLELVLSSDVTYVQLDNLAGPCTDDMRPVVVVIGAPNALTSDREVLSRSILDTFTDADLTSGSVLLPVAPTDEVNTFEDLLSTAQPDEVRVAFCPVGVTSCEP